MRSLSIAFLAVSAALPVFAQQFSPAENLAPSIPTPGPVVDKMLEAAHVKPGDVVYDLGSGDGRIVIAAAKMGAQAVGVEVMPDLCRRARQSIKELGLSDRASIVEGNVFRVDFSAATVVTMYLMTDSNERLRPNLEKYLKPGTRVVSNQFPIKGWKPVSVERGKSGTDYTIYVYQVGHTR
jgi:16S rRNA A1518/A1519 N6-dimethyltransferase RsmA/KsgA/DIM1 with predicted DNA glycosylase/AP lyase activity